MIGVLRKIALLTGKDLRIEARTHQTLSLVVVLGVLIIVVLGLGLGGPGASAFGAPAVLWVAYLFGGVLCFEKTIAVERYDGALASLLAAPIDRGIIFAAKLLVNFVLMLALAVTITPVAIVLFGFDLSAAPWGFAMVVLLSMLGFAAVGTLFAAVGSSANLQSGLLAVLIFPICLPVVIVSTQMLMRLFREGRPLSGHGLGVLVAFDVVFLVVSWLTFERVLEP